MPASIMICKCRDVASSESVPSLSNSVVAAGRTPAHFLCIVFLFRSSRRLRRVAENLFIDQELDPLGYREQDHYYNAVAGWPAFNLPSRVRCCGRGIVDPSPLGRPDMNDRPRSAAILLRTRAL